MGTIIEVDFRHQKQKEGDSFQAFETAMLKHDRAQKFKIAGLMAGLSLMIICLMAVPFVLEYLHTELF